MGDTQRTLNVLVLHEVFARMGADPEIDPNQKNRYGTSIYSMIEAYGTEDMLFRIVQHPHFDTSKYEYFSDKLSRALSDERQQAFTKMLIDLGVQYECIRSDRRRLQFGFIQSHHEYMYRDDHTRFVPEAATPLTALVSTCTSCGTAIKQTEIVVYCRSGNTDDQAKARERRRRCCFHLECAMVFYRTFVSQLIDPNPLERKLLACTCGAEIRPQYIHTLMETIKDVRCVLNMLENGMDPATVLSYSTVFAYSRQYSIDALNDYIVDLKFRADPRYVPCPDELCTGFQLVHPDREKGCICSKCTKPQMFKGSKLVAQSEQETREAAEVMHTGLKPCPTCGKLIDKNEGCHNMECAFCKRAFVWTEKYDVAPRF